MPFTSSISNQSAIRKGASYTRYAIIHTPDVLCQAQPSEDASGLSNAIVTVDSPSTGSVSAIKADYTVFITPSIDYRDDLQQRPNQCLVTYARLDGDGSDIAIGETTFQWTTSQYVTVVKDVRVFQRKERYLDAYNDFRDYTILFRKPKPRIYDLYSEALEIASGDSTVSKSFTPSAESMGGGTISSWAWDVDGNTISTGISSSQNITVDFTAGTHLVTLTVTDSNYITNKLHVLIAVIPADYNSVVTDFVTGNLEHNADGHRAQFIAYSDTEPYLSGSMGIVCTKVRFADGTSLLTTDMVGWLGDISYSTLGSREFGRTRQADIELLDIAYKGSSIVVQQLPFSYTSAPTSWADLASCTPLDMAWHILSEMSTISNVCAIDYPSGYENQTVKEYDTPNGTIIEVVKSLTFSNNKGSLQFSPNGEMAFDISLPYATTSERDSATVVCSLTAQDGDLSFRYPPAGDLAIQYVNAGALRYNTVSNKINSFYGRAPAVTENGILEERIEYMVLPEDTTISNSKALTGQLAFDHWQASNENLTANLLLTGGYLQVRHHQAQWYTFTLSEEDLLNSDITFDSNTRFLCTGISQQYEVNNGRLTCSVQLRQETGGTANYSVVSQELLPAVLTANLPNYPNTPIYPLLTESNPEDVYGDEYEDNTSGYPDPSDNPKEQGNGQINQPPDVLETIQVPATGQVVQTDTVFEVGVVYLLTVSGTMDLGSGVMGSFTLDSSDNSIVDTGLTFVSGEIYAATFSGYWNSGTPIPVGRNIDAFYADFPDDIKRDNTDRFNLSRGTQSMVVEQYRPDHVYEGKITATSSGSVTARFFEGASYADNTGGYSVEVRRVGDADALYRFGELGTSALDGNSGLHFNGSKLTTGDAIDGNYNSSHVYQWLVSISGSDSKFSFEIEDSGGLSDNSGSLTVQIENVGSV